MLQGVSILLSVLDDSVMVFFLRLCYVGCLYFFILLFGFCYYLKFDMFIDMAFCIIIAIIIAMINHTLKIYFFIVVNFRKFFKQLMISPFIIKFL